MPPPSTSASLHLIVLQDGFFVEKYPCDRPVPSWVGDRMFASNPFFSVTRTDEEVSVVGIVDEGLPDEVRKSSPWTAIKIKGPMEHSRYYSSAPVRVKLSGSTGLTGILSDFTAPLKVAKVPIFAISTWNTDYILVPSEKFSEAKEALKTDGWTFV